MVACRGERHGWRSHVLLFVLLVLPHNLSHSVFKVALLEVNFAAAGIGLERFDGVGVPRSRHPSAILLPLFGALFCLVIEESLDELALLFVPGIFGGGATVPVDDEAARTRGLAPGFLWASLSPLLLRGPGAAAGHDDGMNGGSMDERLGRWGDF